MSRVALTIATDHPAYAGHFPGAPVLPGAVLLDAALAAIEAAVPGRRWRIPVAKFLRAVRPGAPLELEFHPQPDGAIAFHVESAGQTVADGTLRPA